MNLIYHKFILIQGGVCNFLVGSGAWKSVIESGTRAFRMPSFFLTAGAVKCAAETAASRVRGVQSARNRSIHHYSTPNFFQQLGTGAVNVMTSLVVGCSNVMDRQCRAIPSGNFCREPYL